MRDVFADLVFSSVRPVLFGGLERSSTSMAMSISLSRFSPSPKVVRIFGLI